MRVSVVIPALNAAGTIGRTLGALGAQDLDAPYEVIVVDDGSDDDTVAIAEEAGATVLRQDREGPGPARNRGAAAASGEALAFTDADCFPTATWLREGVAALERAELVQGRVVPDPDARRGPYDRTVWVVGESGLYETANLLVRRDLFDRLGGFEDWLPARLGKPLAEDVWLGWRARRAGATTAFCEQALVHHAVFRRGPRDYIAERARLVYFPAMARKMPELRRTFFHRRIFLNRRSAEFDLALTGLVVAGAAALLVSVPVGLPALLALLALAPYLSATVGRASNWGRYAPRVALVDLTADAVGFAAMAAGSARHRALVI